MPCYKIYFRCIPKAWQPLKNTENEPVLFKMFYLIFFNLDHLSMVSFLLFITSNHYIFVHIIVIVMELIDELFCCFSGTWSLLQLTSAREIPCTGQSCPQTYFYRTPANKVDTKLSVDGISVNWRGPPLVVTCWLRDCYPSKNWGCVTLPCWNFPTAKNCDSRHGLPRQK